MNSKGQFGLEKEDWTGSEESWVPARAWSVILGRSLFLRPSFLIYKIAGVNNMLSKIFFFFFLHWHAMFLSRREWWLGGGGGRGECRKKKRSHSSGGICLNWWWWKWWVQCEWVLNDKDCVYIKSCYCPSSKVYIAYNEHPLKMTM